MTTPIPPIRPNPYIAPGNDWNIRVQMPGFGRWSRNPQQVSMTYTVYNHGQQEYHITIDTAYINNPANPLNTHVTSNDQVGTRVLHWPNPGTLSVAQQAWMTLHNGAGQFNALIAAFENELQTRAANIQASRDYDRDLALYQQDQVAAAGLRRASAATFEGDLADWLEAYDQADYLDVFKEDNQWYVLDVDRDVIVWLKPEPRPIMAGSSLDKGFINLCAPITGAVPLNATHWGILSARLTLLRFRDKTFAMLKTEFLACSPAKELLSLDQLVEQAVDEWTHAVTSGPQYKMIAADKTVMNINGPDGAHCCVQMLDLVNLTELTLIGTNEAGLQAGTIPLFASLRGVYAISCVSELQVKLPQVIRISRASQRDVYILPDKLIKDWSGELENASNADPVLLANDLAARNISCQVFVENLLFGDDCGLIVYLLRPDGSACYVGSKDEVVPGVRVKDSPFNLHAQADVLKAYFGGGMSVTMVVQNLASAVIVCGSGRKPVTPFIFLDITTLAVLDLPAARKGFVIKEQERLEKEKAAASKADAERKSAAQQFSQVWSLAEPGLQKVKGEVTLLLYLVPEGILAVLPGSEEHTLFEVAEVRPHDRMRIVYEKFAKAGKGTYRYFAIKHSNAATADWIGVLKDYIVLDKPNLPTGVVGYVVTIKKN